MLNSKALAASVSAGPAVYVEDVFSTFLYTGTGSTQTITNGIDLSGKGGLTWIKSRSVGEDHYFFDTARGAGNHLNSNNTGAQESAVGNTDLYQYNANGFTLGPNYWGGVNTPSYTYCSWTFRKQPKFFDVVTWTGDGTNNRQIAHNLGAIPGAIFAKRTSSTADWYVYHRGLGSYSAYLKLNTTAASVDSGGAPWGATPTSTYFVTDSSGSNNFNNANGETYVAYLFAHDAGGFGTAGTDNVVSCGSFTEGSSAVQVNLGFEPQWVIAKITNGGGNWWMFDNMRGLDYSNTQSLRANSSAAELALGPPALIKPTATGFIAESGLYGAGSTVIYIAIRRGPMKTPTVGTSVFGSVATTASSGTVRNTNIVFDMTLSKARTLSGQIYVQDRLRGFPATDTQYLIKELYTTTTGAEGSGDGYAFQHGINNYQTQYVDSNYYSGYSYILHAFRRAPGFFDVVAYTGTGANIALTHNLGVAPELVFIKKRSNTGIWITYSKSIAIDRYLLLNGTGSSQSASGFGDWPWNNTAPTASIFNIGYSSSNNADYTISSSGATYIAYLFATAPGVSKVGSYTGTGTTLSIDCGFTAGARFVLIKRTDSTGDWYVWDTARGIISGNDPYLLINSTAAEVTGTDYIDPLSSGFEISSTAPAAINANGGSFIFLAIA
jgi:hypothetical protein